MSTKGNFTESVKIKISPTIKPSDASTDEVEPHIGFFGDRNHFFGDGTRKIECNVVKSLPSATPFRVQLRPLGA